MRPKHFLFVPLLTAAIVAIACVGLNSLFKRNTSINLFSLWFRKLGRTILRS